MEGERESERKRERESIKQQPTQGQGKKKMKKVTRRKGMRRLLQEEMKVMLILGGAAETNGPVGPGQHS